METDVLTVGQLAHLTKVSVRTLHHYDEIGLLPPAGRSEAGYRLYDQAAVARLHQILVMRELGLTLESIRLAMDDPDFDTVSALERQLRELDGTIDRLGKVRTSIESMLQSMTTGDVMNTDDIKEVFDGFDPSEYQAEVEERWGDTEAYRASQRRTAGYSKADWQRIKNEGDEIEAAFAAALEAGTAPEDATEIAERHRLQIDRWFYPCSHEMHVNLAEMYVTDPRFAEHYNSRAGGLAEFVSSAIKANAAKH